MWLFGGWKAVECPGGGDEGLVAGSGRRVVVTAQDRVLGACYNLSRNMA